MPQSVLRCTASRRWLFCIAKRCVQKCPNTRPINGIEADARPIHPPSQPPHAQAQAAQEPAPELPGLRLCGARAWCSSPARPAPATCCGRLEGSARLREPRQVRAAGDDAHPRARRRADRRVRARAAHLRADQHDPEARDRAPSCRPRTALLRARRRRLPGHRARRLQGSSRRRSRAATRRAEGASTITQQVAKNFLLTSERSIERKIKEAILAIRIERAYSKDKILELYLNEIYLGIGAYGVAAASLSYFNKELQDLTIEEVAYLAALPKAPNNYHPFRQTRQATERRNWIIGQMAENGYITAEEAEAAKKKPLGVNIRPTRRAHLRRRVLRRGSAAHAARRSTARTSSTAAACRCARRSIRKLQQIARRALIDGLVEFDRSKGWRGPVAKIDIAGDWGVALGAVDSPADIQPWRLGVVLKTRSRPRRSSACGPRSSRTARSSTSARRSRSRFDEMKWAKSAGQEDRRPRRSTDVARARRRDLRGAEGSRATSAASGR